MGQPGQQAILPHPRLLGPGPLEKFEHKNNMQGSFARLRFLRPLLP